ncbi:hypothetical protein ES288_D05G330800v1 [Gossypium darwinii]|uniref:Ribosomal protein L14 n=1 Tax=Gossypium darwinii TaxID=34276 RepID=A0A5D2CM90_GOSDA|nr:hypothetical protein ES288_D05G330800v1 [Gossypium darwinii]
MIQPQTHLNVADNSGARELVCIRIIGASNRRYAHICDIIVAVIKEIVLNTPLERSEVIIAIIVCTHKELKHDNGMIIRYDDNVAVVIDQEGNPKGTQIFGIVRRDPSIVIVFRFTMGKDTIANIKTSIRNADMNRKGTIQIGYLNKKSKLS